MLGARAFRAGDCVALAHDDSLVFLAAVVADVLIDRHFEFLRVARHYTATGGDQALHSSARSASRRSRATRSARFSMAAYTPKATAARARRIAVVNHIPAEWRPIRKAMAASPNRTT